MLESQTKRMQFIAVRRHLPCGYYFEKHSPDFQFQFCVCSAAIEYKCICRIYSPQRLGLTNTVWVSLEIHLKNTQDSNSKKIDLQFLISLDDLFAQVEKSSFCIISLQQWRKYLLKGYYKNKRNAQLSSEYTVFFKSIWSPIIIDSQFFSLISLLRMIYWYLFALLTARRNTLRKHGGCMYTKNI